MRVHANLNLPSNEQDTHHDTKDDNNDENGDKDTEPQAKACANWWTVVVARGRQAIDVGSVSRIHVVRVAV